MLLICAGTQGQVLTDSGNQGLMLVTTKKNDDLNKIEGSPYLDEDFREGTATVNGKKLQNIFLRYNVLEENIEIKTQPGEEAVYMLPDKEQVLYIIGSDSIKYNQIIHEGKVISGYFVNSFTGEKYKLLKKPEISFAEAVKAKTGYEKDKPAKMNITEKYYLLQDGKEVIEVSLKHRDIKRLFQSEPSKNYLSDNKVRSEQDLISFIAWLDNQ